MIYSGEFSGCYSGQRGWEVRGGSGRREGEKKQGRRRTTGRAKAREATLDLLLRLQRKHGFWSFSLVGEATPFGGAFSFWSFWKKQKLPKALPNRASVLDEDGSSGWD